MHTTKLALALIMSSVPLRSEIAIVASLDVSYSQADIVCRGEISSVITLAPVGTTDVSGMRAPIDYHVTLSPDWCYKGGAGSGQLIMAVRGYDQIKGRPAKVGEYDLVFLKGAGTIKEMAAPWIRFWKTARPSGSDSAGGLPQLERDLVVLATTGSGGMPMRDALETLEEFNDPGPEAYAALAPLTRSEDGDARVLSAVIRAFAAVARRGGPGALRQPAFEELAIALRGRVQLPGDNTLERITYLLTSHPAAEDLGALEELSRHPIPGIRFSAMDGIRTLRSEGTIPFLVGQLDSDDVDVQYEAVVTLAELTGKGGDFGPGRTAFGRDPEKYKNLWKQWWAAGGLNEANARQ